MRTISENSVVAYYDENASFFLKQAAAWATLADNAKLKQRAKYWAKAEEYRRKANEALENAKITAGRIRSS